MKIRGFITVFAMLGTLLAGGTVLATSASASGYGCNGTLVGSQAINEGTFAPADVNKFSGELYVYWDGTYNCAVAVDPSENASYISVSIEVCDDSVPTFPCDRYSPPRVTTDASSSYHWYAGPVNVNGVGRCIMVTGTIHLADGTNVSNAYEGAGYC